MFKYLTQITATITARKEIEYDGVTYKRGDSFLATAVFVKDYRDPNGWSILFTGTSIASGPHEISEDELIRKYAVEWPSHDSSVTIEQFCVDEEDRLVCKHRNYEYYIKYETASNGVKGLGITEDSKEPDILRIKSDDQLDAPSLWIQAGANANQGINISLVDGTAAGLGLTGVSVLSATAAGNAIQTVDGAISQVSRYRSDFGAQQNRLEHAMAVDDNTAENLQAAESRIRDADMADEMVTNARITIMEQSMQAMLANANRQTEGMLALLQG